MEFEKLELENLDQIAGGVSSSDSRYDLKNFTHKKVVLGDQSACLTLRSTPGGSIVPCAGWKDGNNILVHNGYTEGGWYFAYDQGSGSFGYVNPDCVR
jgi:hypothetical protein